MKNLEQQGEAARRAARVMMTASTGQKNEALAGMAQAVAAAVDSLKLEEVLGSIAGDDTILIVCRTEKYAEEIVRMLTGLVK